VQPGLETLVLTIPEAMWAYSCLCETDSSLWEDLNGLAGFGIEEAEKEETDEAAEEECPFNDADADLDDMVDNSALEPDVLIMRIIKPSSVRTDHDGVDSSLAEELDAIVANFNFDHPDTENFGQSKCACKENTYYTDGCKQIGKSP
jgi:hypothetical protein